MLPNVTKNRRRQAVDHIERCENQLRLNAGTYEHLVEVITNLSCLLFRKVVAYLQALSNVVKIVVAKLPMLSNVMKYVVA